MKLFAFKFNKQFLDIADLHVGGTKNNQQTYLEESIWEYKAFENHIKSPKKILDLGCGLGRMSVFLNSQLQDKTIKYILADSTGGLDKKHRAGWNPGQQRYNNLSLTKEFVKLNGLKNFETFDIFRDDWNQLKDIDFVMSFLSVGFHYPIENSLPKLLKITSKGSTMVFGVRRGRYNNNSFKEYFEKTKLVISKNKHYNTRKQGILILENKL